MSQSVRSSKSEFREFSDETKMVIHHLQEALLDIIDLNLGREELKVAVHDYLAELVEAGPAYVEVEKYPRRHGPSNNLGKTLKSVGFSLTQCSPRLHLFAAKPNFPFTGQDPSAAMREDVIECESPSKPPLRLSTRSPGSTQKTSFGCQSDPASGAPRKPADFEANARILSAHLSHSGQKCNTVRSDCCRHLLSSRRADRYPPVCQSLDPDSDVEEGHSISDYIEEFEDYIRHKYSSSERRRSQCADNPQVHRQSPRGHDEMADCVAEGLDAVGGCVNDSRKGDASCQPSKFELFLQKASTDVGGTECRDREIDESFGLGEKLTENQRQIVKSSFEKFLRKYEAPPQCSSSAESMTEEEFYRELLRVEPPKK